MKEEILFHLIFSPDFLTGLFHQTHPSLSPDFSKTQPNIGVSFHLKDSIQRRVWFRGRPNITGMAEHEPTIVAADVRQNEVEEPEREEESAVAATKMAPTPAPAPPTLAFPTVSVSIWPPSQRTRDAVIGRLVETLTTPSVLTKRYVALSSDEASDVARRIEEEAFVTASAEVKGGDGEGVGMEDDGFGILQIYSQTVSKRMLDAVKVKAAASTQGSDASEVSAAGSVAGESAEASDVSTVP